MSPAARFAGSAKRWAGAQRLPNLDAVAPVVASTVSGGRAHGSRALDVRVLGGVDLRLLPDRGLDIGQAWFGGVPLAWCSAVGETSPLPAPTGAEWNDAFGGGLVATCGLRNVGAASEGHGQHGLFSHQRAAEVHVHRDWGDRGEIVVTVTGVIVEASALGPHLRVERTVRTRTGAGQVELEDTTTNLGMEAEAVPLLYHVNIGAALWDEGSRLDIDSIEAIPRDEEAARWVDAWSTPPAEPSPAERVFEHRVEPGADGWAQARVTSPSAGVVLTLRWDAELPRFHQWVHPGAGVWALGLEPANCSVRGRAVDRAEGRLPELEPGASRTTRLVLQVEHGV